MKPTFQINRESRRIDSPRSNDQHISKSPTTDWSFQSAADLRGGAAVSTPITEQGSPVRGLHALTQGLFDAKTKWEDRIEGVGLTVVTALAAWPVLKAAQTAMSTVGYW